MSDDILDSIDAAVEGAREDVCACGCGRQLSSSDPSPYFAGPDCQLSWHLQQQAIADGEPERAEEMRRQRGEDPIDRLRRRTRELTSDEERAVRERRLERIAEWLRANGIDPMRVAEDYPIITTPTSIIVHDYTRDEDDHPCLVDGAVATVEEMYPLRVAWPADLDYEHHRFELDEDDNDADRRGAELFISMAGACGLLNSGEQLDATELMYGHPFLYRIRCTGCGRRGQPLDAETRVEADGSLQRHWVCTCGTHVCTADVTATVERFTQADGLDLRLGYGREQVRYLLPDHQLHRYDSLDPIWREMEQLLATSQRLPWSNPRSNPLRDVQEVAGQAYRRGAGTLSVAPVDTPPNWDGWVDLGHMTDDGLEYREGVDVEPDGSRRSYHSAGMAVDLSDVRAERARRWMANWAGAAQAARLAAWQIQALAAMFGVVVERLRPIAEAANNPMPRAIEAKKNRTHGPQGKKRAPRRIDPTRRR